MGPKTEELVIVLEELNDILGKYSVENWAQWMEKALTRIENSDFSGITHLLGAYGGMGSFNDLILSSHDAQQPKGTTIDQDNARLDELASKAYSLATDIKREYERQ